MNHPNTARQRASIISIPGRSKHTHARPGHPSRRRAESGPIRKHLMLLRSWKTKYSTQVTAGSSFQDENENLDEKMIIAVQKLGSCVCVCVCRCRSSMPRERKGNTDQEETSPLLHRFLFSFSGPKAEREGHRHRRPQPKHTLHTHEKNSRSDPQAC